MRRYFTVKVFFPDGNVATFPHVSEEKLDMSSSTNFSFFVDEHGKTHITTGLAVIADEES